MIRENAISYKRAEKEGKKHIKKGRKTGMRENRGVIG